MNDTKSQEKTIKTLSVGKESGHWYNENGLVETVPNAKGDKQIKPDVRHAKKFNLYPSVTTILGVVAKPNLTKWQINEHIRACSYIDKQGKDESFSDYCARVSEQMQKFNDHAQVGTDIHSEIAKALLQPHYIYNRVIRHALGYIIKLQKDTCDKYPNSTFSIEVENPFINHALAYGGTIDFKLESEKEVIILDFKSTDDEKLLDEKKRNALAYKDSHLVQLVAYGNAMLNEQTLDKTFRYINVFIGRVEGDIHVHEWDKEEDILWAREYFAACRKLFSVMKGV